MSNLFPSLNCLCETSGAISIQTWSHDSAVCLQVDVLGSQVSWVGELSHQSWQIARFLGLVPLPLAGWKSRGLQLVVQH